MRKDDQDRHRQAKEIQIIGPVAVIHGSIE
jgi:hypothetical protein